MNKTLKITSIIIILIAIGVSSWFLVTKKSQNSANLTQKNTKIEDKGWQKEVNIANKKWSKNSKEVREKFEKYIREHGEKIELEKVDTTGWKTYTDNQRGFSFQYPSDWYVLSVDGLNSLEGIEEYYSSETQRGEKKLMKQYVMDCNKPFSEASSIKGCTHPYIVLCLADKYKYENMAQRFKEKNSIDGEYAREYCNIVFNEYFPVLKSSKRSSGEMLLESIIVGNGKYEKYINNNNMYLETGATLLDSFNFSLNNGNYIEISGTKHTTPIILQTLKYTN